MTELRGYAIYTSGSYASHDYSGTCAPMSAKSFYDIELAAGQSSDSILSDLNDMQASEDFALIAELGGSFIGADPTALAAISASTRAPSSVAVGGLPVRASATPNGTLTVGSTSTVPSFLFGTTNPPTTSVAATPTPLTGSGQAFTAAVTGLSENATYYVQALGTYEVVDPADAMLTVQGTVPGAIVSFITPSSSKTNQTVTFGSLGGRAYGDSSFFVSTPTATSSLPVTVTSATTAVCTVSAYTVTITGVGSCVLTANQPGKGTFNAAPAVEQAFTVSPGSPTITFGTIPSKLRSSAAFAVSPTASSGLGVSLTSSTTGVCTVSSLTITLTAVGAPAR